MERNLGTGKHVAVIAAAEPSTANTVFPPAPHVIINISTSSSSTLCKASQRCNKTMLVKQLASYL